MPETLAAIDRIWQELAPTRPIQRQFVDSRIERLYRDVTRQGEVFAGFALVAVLIACLGLFGLSAFAITQRIKELGIRKVLGASVGGIVSLLSKDFLKLVGIAAMIAFPLAWFAMHRWLQDFAYHISIQWWIFILAAFAALCVALITVSSLAIKAASANPVRSLRME